MKATIPYIEQKFREFNQRMFAGRLPMVRIELSNAKTYLGACACRKRKLPGGLTELYDFRLRITTRVEMSEQELEDTIIHEMIHYYIGVNKLKDSSPHGPVFRRMMESINKKHDRHLRISHKYTAEQREQAYDKRPRWHIVAVVSFRDGRTGLKVLPKAFPKIINYYNKVGKHSRVNGIRLFMTNNVFFNRFPCSSALNVVYVDYDKVTEHLEGAEIMECDGISIISNGHK